MAEYRKEFVTMLKHLGRVDEPVMLRTFLRGLKDEVKYELKVLGPTTLEQAMCNTPEFPTPCTKPKP